MDEDTTESNLETPAPADEINYEIDFTLLLNKDFDPKNFVPEIEFNLETIKARTEIFNNYYPEA